MTEVYRKGNADKGEREEIVEAHHAARKLAEEAGKVVRVGRSAFRPAVTPQQRRERVRLARAFVSSPIGGGEAA